LNYEQVYYVPAVLGSLAMLILVVACVKTCAEVCVCTPGETPAEEEHSGV
jgi:hypothetical protein